jgi:hypothetical protein
MGHGKSPLPSRRKEKGEKNEQQPTTPIPSPLQNKSLSDSIEPALIIQGVSWVTRKALGFATVTLETKQYVAPPKPIGGDPAPDQTPVTHIDIQQIATAGLKGTREERCLDGQFREHSDWLFGTVQGKSRFLDLDEVEDDFLKAGWDADATEPGGPDGKKHVLSHAENLDPSGGWTAIQIWGFQVVDGERRYVRNVVVQKDDQRAEFRLVYDWQE